MREKPPPESEVEELFRLGLDAAPPGDNAARVRLLGLRAGWPFGYPDKTRTLEESEEFERVGLEAAEMALRLGEPNLAAGSFDQAGAAWVARGWYGRAQAIWERRLAIIPQVTDILEIGDTYAMGAWGLYEMGRYAEAVAVSDAGMARVTGRGANVELHNRSWRVASLHRLGEWDEALEEFGHIREVLEDRRDDPPYFVSHAFAAAASIHEARGDRVHSDRFAGLLMRLTGEGQGRLHAWLLRFLVQRGELDAARRLPRATTWRIHAGDTYESESELIAALGLWDEAPELLRLMREHAAAADTSAVYGFADRLEGRAALAGGDAVRAVDLLERGATRFAELDAPWERALTQLDLGTALVTSGRHGDAADVAAGAVATFERLGCAKDLARARALAEKRPVR
jgi:tetratricopeptide (TPR) repeat protein